MYVNEDVYFWGLPGMYDQESKTVSRTFTKQDEEAFGTPEGFMT